MKNQILALAAFGMIGLSACKKEAKLTQEEPLPKSDTELLTQAAWNFETLIAVEEANGVVIDESRSPLFGKAHFYNDFTVQTQMHGDSIETAYWSMNQRSISIDDLPFTIQTLTETRLELVHEELEDDPEAGRMIYRETIILNR